MKNLKYARKNSGLTQKEVAEKLGIPVTTYANYEQIETSKPSTKNLIELANMFQCSIDYLVGRENYNMEIFSLSKSKKKLVALIEELDESSCARAEAYLSGLVDGNREHKRVVSKFNLED